MEIVLVPDIYICKSGARKGYEANSHQTLTLIEPDLPKGTRAGTPDIGTQPRTTYENSASQNLSAFWRYKPDSPGPIGVGVGARKQSPVPLPLPLLPKDTRPL